MSPESEPVVGADGVGIPEGNIAAPKGRAERPMVWCSDPAGVG